MHNIPRKMSMNRLGYLFFCIFNPKVKHFFYTFIFWEKKNNYLKYSLCEIYYHRIFLENRSNRVVYFFWLNIWAWFRFMRQYIAKVKSDYSMCSWKYFFLYALSQTDKLISIQKKFNLIGFFFFYECTRIKEIVTAAKLKNL